MSIENGHLRYKKHIKQPDGTYKLISQWTSSDTVHMNDDTTLESTVVAINEALDTKVPEERKVNGKVLSADITLSAADVNADASGSANTALASAKSYTDSEIAKEITARDAAIETAKSGVISTAASDATTKSDNALKSAKSYTDTEISKEVTARDSAIATAKSSAISTAASDATTKADAALASAKTYADGIKNDLLNGAGAAYDTLSELGDLIDDNQDAIEALESIAASKANASDLTSHTGNTTVHITSTERTNWNDANAKKHSHSNKTVLDNTTASFTTEEKNKLAGIAASANAYTHPSYTAKSSGLYKVTVDASGHVSATTAVAKADITGLGIPAQDTTYSAATTSAAGLMSASDKTKLDGIATGANAYTLPTASSSTIGGVKTTSTVTSTSGLTACPIISGVPYYKDTNTTYSAATTSAAGLMSAADKVKLNGVPTFSLSGTTLTITTS